MTTRRIDEIVVGERHRRDLGDIDGLAESIEDIGLLHPITVDEQGRLLAGARTAETFALQAAELRYVCTIGRFVDGRLAEIFAGSHADACARDSAVICSIALQHGVPVDVLARALMRDSRGRPETPLGAALARIVETEEERR